MKFTEEKPMQLIGKTITLNENQRLIWLGLLTNDAHFEFEVMKKCVFLPEMVITFKGEHEAQALVNLSCNQLKIISGEESKLLDYEPAKTLFAEFFGGLDFGQQNGK